MSFGEDTNINISSSTLDQNLANQSGGALKVDNNMILGISNLIVRHNIAREGYGGVFSSGNRFKLYSKNIAFVGNAAMERNGGCISGSSNGSAVFDNVSFTSNSAGKHGGVVVYDDAVNIAFVNSKMENNRAGLSGGCLFLQNSN